MRTFFLSAASWLFSLTLFAQYEDNVWQITRTATLTTDTAAVLLDFKTATVLSAQSTAIPLEQTYSAICDSSGHLLFYTNGLYIADSTHSIMQNGSGLNPNSAYTNDRLSDINAYRIPHATLIFRQPDSNDTYYVFHQTVDTFSGIIANFSGTKLLYSIVDMRLNGGKGAVTQKKPVITC